MYTIYYCAQVDVLYEGIFALLYTSIQDSLVRSVVLFVSILSCHKIFINFFIRQLYRFVKLNMLKELRICLDIENMQKCQNSHDTDAAAVRY